MYGSNHCSLLDRPQPAPSVSSKIKYSFPENPLVVLLVPYRLFFRENLGYCFFTENVSEPRCHHLSQIASILGLLVSNELGFEKKRA